MKPLTDLGKPSIINVSSLFAGVNILIADADNKMAILSKKVLLTLGCNKIFIVHNGLEAIALMKEETIDIVVTDWAMKSMGGLELTRHLRYSPESPNRMIPVVMLCANTDRHHVEQARDAGITEYVMKPFSAKSLLERVYDVVQNPRNFILSKHFIGPDRRRKSSLTLPELPNSRVQLQRTPPVVVPRESLSSLIIDDTPRMILPDYTLKKKIGFDVAAITSPAALEQSQAAIANSHDEFMKAMASDMRELETAYHTLITSPDNAMLFIEKIKQLALSIQTRAGMFGFPRAGQVAELLHDFCEKHYDRSNRYHLIILEKHIQIIGVVFARNITSDGGAVGAALLADLSKLVKKYSV